MSGQRKTTLAVAVAALACVVVSAVANAASWTFEARVASSRATGWVALVFFLGSLAATPFRKTLPVIRSWRRPLGIAAACCASVHGVLSLRALGWELSVVWTWPVFRAGALAWTILMLLLLTSSPTWVRKLKIGEWKALHALVYVAAFFIAQHLLLLPFATTIAALAVSVILGALLLVRLRPNRKKTKSP